MKPPAPKIELDELTADQVMAMPHGLLANMDAKQVKWVCVCKGCNRFTRVLDFGIGPYYLFRKKWIRSDAHYFLCAKHWKYHKRLAPVFGEEKFMQKFVDFDKLLSQLK